MALPSFLQRVFVLAAFWVPLAICMAVATTPDPTGVVASLSGQVAHILAFVYLTAASFPAHFHWRRGGGRPEAGSGGGEAGAGERSVRRCVLAAALWMLAFGVAIEVAQLFVAGRSGALADLLPNAVGIATGCALAPMARRFFPKAIGAAGARQPIR